VPTTPAEWMEALNTNALGGLTLPILKEYCKVFLYFIYINLSI